MQQNGKTIQSQNCKKKPAIKTPAKKKASQLSPETSASKKRVKPAAIKSHSKTPVKNSAAKRKRAKLTDTAQILEIVKRSKRGLDVATLQQKTGFDDKKIRNLIYKAFRQGIIKCAGRGIYLGA